jgi:NADH dehydrogenase
MPEQLDLSAHRDDASPDSASLVGPARAELSLSQPSQHRVAVVGGGAAGLELVTWLGDRLGRRGRADVALAECTRTHVWKPLLHEVAAGGLDPAENEVNYLAQAHWHGFRLRLGEMTGLDRAGKRVHLAATFDDEGREITPSRAVGYDTLVIAVGSITNDFGSPPSTRSRWKPQPRPRASTSGW